MAKDLLRVLQEIRGTGEPEAAYTDGIYHDITIKPHNGHAGKYGDIVAMHGGLTTVTAEVGVLTDAAEAARDIAILSANSAEASRLLTTADVVLTHADVVITTADTLQTGLDVIAAEAAKIAAENALSDMHTLDVSAIEGPVVGSVYNALTNTLELTLPKGSTGDTGAQGIQGPIGPQGDQGYSVLSGTVAPTNQGVNNDLYLDTTTSDVYKKIAGVWVLQSNIKGLTGLQGIQGIQGLTGSQGIKGDTGNIGATGATGPQGIQGNAGIQGIQGVKGDTGNTGATGSTAYQSAVANGFVGTEAAWLLSLVGAQGIQGIKGDTGSQGIQGIQGEIGLQGIQGIQGIKGDIGNTGNGITDITRTSGTGAAGSTDTYTITYTDTTTDTLSVYNGADGLGSGDMLKATYDTTNNGKVDDAEKVNGLTVQTAVPSGAVFTDTVYDDTAITMSVNKLSDIATDTNEPTGFIREFPLTMGVIELSPDGTKVISVDWNGTTSIRTNGLFYDGSTAAARQFAIHPVSIADGGDGKYYVYIEGVKHTISSTQKVTFANTTGLKFVYHELNGTLGVASSFDFDYFEDRPITATVYGNAVNQELVNFGDERHGIQMDGFTHRYLHFTQGTQYISGMEIQGLTSNGTTYSQITSGYAYDEDIYMNPPQQTNAPHLWIEGTAWRVVNDTNAVGHLVSGVARYNLNTAGVYSLAPVTGNDAMIVFFVLTNNREFPYVKILGQKVYADTNAARADMENALSDLTLAGLPSPEFLPIGAVIIRSTGAIQTLSDGSLYYDLRKVKSLGSGSTSGVSQYHADLLGRDLADSHPASAVTNTPAGNIVATTVQAAINELDSEKASTAVATTSTNGLMSSTDKTKIDGVSGSNTGDETSSTIKTKLGITTLSGTNTGDQDLSGKQDTLVSGTNIKTVNGASLLGSGNIVISGGGSSVSYGLLNNSINQLGGSF